MRSLWLLSVSVLALSFATPSAALDKTYEAAFDRELWTIIKKQPKYTWGGCTDEAQGVDCSGFIYLAAKRAGLPVKRTTAKNMAYGLSGWSGVSVGVREAHVLHLIWWTWRDAKPTREHGHVGVVVLGSGSRLLEVGHSSQTKRYVVVQPCEGKLLTEISEVKRLTIGDK